jgi:hypothetical protein
MMRLLWFLLLLSSVPAHAAIDCDGVDDVLTGAALSNFITVGTKTYMVWYTPAGAEPTATDCSAGAAQKILGSEDGASNFIYISRKNATTLCGGNRDGDYDSLETTYAGAGTTVHLAVTHSGGTLSLYHNGVFVASGSSGNTEQVTNALKVCDGRGNPAQGVVHHVALYDVLVPVSEIAALASNKRPRLRRTMPTGEWLFDNCAPGTSGDAVVFRDHSGQSRTLTGDNGANNTGLTCQASVVLGRHGGIQ